MRAWRNLIWLALCLALAGAALAESPPVIRVAAGETFTLELPAKPSKAMGWRLVGRLPAERLELDSVRYRQTDPDSGAGVEAWTFQALWPGRYTIHLEYRRSWGRAIKPAEQRTYLVQVTGRPPLGEEAEE